MKVIPCIDIYDAIACLSHLRSEIALEFRFVMYNVLSQPDPSPKRMDSPRCFYEKIKFCVESKFCSRERTKID